MVSPTPSQDVPPLTTPPPVTRNAVQAAQLVEKPYQPSYFLPGKVEGKAALFLLDTGCNTNLISKHVFDRLAPRIQQGVEPCSSHGIMADGTRLPFYGLIQLEGKLRDVKFRETFVISQINEDAILGMPFLTSHGCIMEFGRPTITIDNRELSCTDRYGRLLVSHVHIVRQQVLPPRMEAAILCRISVHNYPPIGVIESHSSELPIATSLNYPDAQRHVTVRCFNPTRLPLTLSAGTRIGTYTGVEEEDIQLPKNVPASNISRASYDGAPRDREVPAHVKDMYQEACKSCQDDTQKQRLARLFREYAGVFSRSDQDVGRTELVHHDIPVEEGTQPIRQPPHRLGPQKELEAEKQVQELLQQGLIEPSDSAWSSPVVLVKKKDGTWRFCIDYRKLNAVTRQDAYPLPRIDDSLDALAGSRYFSTLDLTSGYWQVPLSKDAQEKSSFTTRSGLWKWKVLPFGLTSAPATFQRLMEQVLHGLHWKSLLLYLDDVIVIAPDFSTHIQRLEEVLQRLQLAGLKLKPSKCELFQKEVKYLGHIVSQHGVATDPKKIEAIKDWPPPNDVRSLQAFLGTVGYYRQYLPNYATVAKPLTLLTGKKVPWQWTDTEADSFRLLKAGMMSAPVLGYPDPALRYTLDTDASNVGVGAVLSQEQNGVERVIAYYSKTLAPPERNYCVTRRELLAVVKAVKHFRPYLYGQEFRLRTDHASLRWLCRRHEPSAQVARWLEILAEFQYSLEHRAGLKHGNADGLSRKPQCDSCRQCELIERRDGGPSRRELEAEDPGAWKLLPSAPDTSVLDIAEFPPLGSTGLQAAPLDRQPSPHISATQTTTQTDLVLAQQAPGTDVGIIYNAVRTQTELTEEEVQGGSTELRILHQLFNSLRIRKDGVLEVRLHLQHRARRVILCPRQARETVIWDSHLQAHVGVHKTTERVRLTWYWPGMTADIRRAIKTCEICQVAKHGGLHPAGGRRRLFAGRPWQQVAIDLVGPFPPTSRGNRWILVLSDHFTRWQDALPLPDATANTVAQVLEERIFSYFGLPEQLHSDQGAQFESQLLAELCSKWNIRKTHTTPYHPQANGIVERNNRSLGDSLRTLLLNKGVDEWDRVLPQIMRTFRGTPHATTGETANLMMLGRELRLPDQLQYQQLHAEEMSREDYMRESQLQLSALHQQIRSLQKSVRQENTEEPLTFTPGDLVLLENKRRRKGDSAKLQPKFLGPYHIIQAFPNHTYLIERQGQRSTQNECRMKLYTSGSTLPGRAPGSQEPPRRPNMKGATGKEGTRIPVLPPLPVVETAPKIPPTIEKTIEHSTENSDTLNSPATANPETSPTLELLKQSLEQLQVAKESCDSENRKGRSQRTRRVPERYQAYEVSMRPAPFLSNHRRITDKYEDREKAPKREYKSEQRQQLPHSDSYLPTDCTWVSQINKFRQNYKLNYLIMDTSSDSLNLEEVPFLTYTGEDNNRASTPLSMEQSLPGEETIEALLNMSLQNSNGSASVGDKPPPANCVGYKDIGNTADTTREFSTPPTASATADIIRAAWQAVDNSRSEINMEAPVEVEEARAEEPALEVLIAPEEALCEEPPVSVQQVELPAPAPTPQLTNRQKKRRSKMKKYVSTHTEELIREAADKEAGQCRICRINVAGRHLLKHLRQHFTRVFCRCGFQSPSKDVVARHQRQHQHGPEHGQRCLEAERSLYPKLCRDMGWQSPPPFEDCIPALRHGKKYQTPQELVNTLYQPTHTDGRVSIFRRLGEPIPRRLVSPPPAIRNLQVENHPPAAPPAPRRTYWTSRRARRAAERELQREIDRDTATLRRATADLEAKRERLREIQRDHSPPRRH